ncbi:MAG TPA: ribose-phosphate pyrophosphokinase [Firmicutes bacterium]|nr:ribose-phosphate pyrophosphokinase [Candidatus Fermentithermobacillaceae bacterium]
MKIFGGRATQALTQDICSYLDIPPGQADIFKFPNDNTFVQIKENVRNVDVFVVQTSVPPVDEALMELLIMIDALRRASAKSITAVLPYYPYVRSDKKDQPRVPITARLVADLLVTAGVNRIVTVDLTADQIQGFFTIPADHLTAQPVFARYFKEKGLENPVVVAPDPGAVKRAQRFSERIGAPIAFIDKRRMGTEVRATTVIGDVGGKQAILFDEEVDQGSSLVKAAEMLLDKGASEVYGACTHAVLSGAAPERLSKAPIKELVVTDTVPVPPAKRWDNLVVLSIAPLLAECIRCIQGGQSVSALFM